MVKLNRAQRLALKRIFDRTSLIARVGPNNVLLARAAENEPNVRCEDILTYRQFRTLVHSGWDCVMVPWCGMWLGIEPDGYTHS